jgi:hypothetical protein
MVQAVDGSGLQVSLMPDETYIRFWPQIEAELDKVPHILWENRYTREYLRDVPLHRELMVWCSVENRAVMTVIFAQFTQTPRGKGLCFVLAIGQGLDKALLLLEATFERFAQETDCDYVEIYGRRGWLRKLNGFREDCVVMSKQLRNFKVQ